MKAALLTDYGGVEKLEVRDVPDPEAGSNQVKIRMAGAGINPIDLKLRSGSARERWPLQLPAILGVDASGVVVQVGQGVTTPVGARVMGFVHAAYAEQVIAPAQSWVEVPGKLDLVDAGALPLVLTTGAQLIEEVVKPREGEVVLITGAVGGVGRAAVFAAKARGAKVWAGVLRAHKAEAEKLGAEGVVALDDDAEVAALPQLDSIADTVNGETIRKLFGKIKPGGTIGTTLGEPAGAKERGLNVHALMAHSDATVLARFARAVADGKLVMPIAKKLPLTEVREAHRLAEEGVGGKVVLTGTATT